MKQTCPSPRARTADSLDRFRQQGLAGSIVALRGTSATNDRANWLSGRPTHAIVVNVIAASSLGLRVGDVWVVMFEYWRSTAGRRP